MSATTVRTICECGHEAAHQCPLSWSQPARHSRSTRAARRAALCEAADVAEDVANELFAAYDTEQGNGAMAVAARLRARTDAAHPAPEEPQP